jgi:hypothetical protein
MTANLFNSDIHINDGRQYAKRSHEPATKFLLIFFDNDLIFFIAAIVIFSYRGRELPSLRIKPFLKPCNYVKIMPM